MGQSRDDMEIDRASGGAGTSARSRSFPMQPLAPEVVLRTSGPLRPPRSSRASSAGPTQARHDRPGSGSRRPTRGSSCDLLLASSSSGLGLERPAYRRNQPLAAAVDRTPHKWNAPCLGAGPFDLSKLSESHKDRAFVRNRFALPVGLGGGGFRPKGEQARFLDTQQHGPAVPGNIICPGHVALAGLGLWRGLLQRRERGRLLCP